MAGYSRKPLVDKLGIKAGHKVAILNAPEGYAGALGELPQRVALSDDLTGAPLDFIHFFTKRRDELEGEFPRLHGAMAQNGSLWVSWPKGASKVATDLNENVVREIGLRNQLVDVKVAAVDDTWSGLKFVIRLRDRK